MKYLEIKYSTSRGRDTYGYNLVTLIDQSKRYRTCGGGYDMVGTVFGQWLFANYLERLKTIPCRKHCQDDAGYYGLFDRGNGLYIDGACGFRSMEAIAKAIGLEIREVYKKRVGTIAIIVTEVQS